MPYSSLEELKKIYPKGYHRPDFNGNNAMEAHTLVFQKGQVPGINVNHGWKLHADLKSELTFEEAYAKIGIRPTDFDPKSSIGTQILKYDVIDQDLFAAFNKRVKSLGIDFEQMKGLDPNAGPLARSSDKIRWLNKFMLQSKAKGKFVDPNDTLSLVELLGENDIGFKFSSTYVEGKQFTFYSQNIEERDRIISALESSDIGDRLEDQYDPAYRKIIDPVTEQKNAPISKKTSGRFTTDYLNPYYVDDNGLPYLDLQHNPEDLGVVKDRPGRTRATPAQEAENKKFLISGTLDQEDILAIDKVSKDFPQMRELLEGKPGYVTPYASIQDQIEYRRKLGGSPSAPSPTPVTTPTTADIAKALGGKPSGNRTPKVNPTAQKFIDTALAELEQERKIAVQALPSTKKVIEESGYLYHYAPREARDSILSDGLRPSQARTAIYDTLSGSAHSAYVPKNSLYFFTDPNYAPSADIIFGATEAGQRPDLYRIKIEPGMLDDMVVDPRLPILAKPGYETTGVASAVILPSKTDSFKAELIGERAVFEEISGVAKYTPIVSQPSKPIGRPVISTRQKPPPPTKAGSQQTAVRVTQSGNATPKPQAAIASTPKPTSTGAPLAATSPASRSLADNMSQAVTKGIKGSGGLKMLGAAALVGLGASAISRRRTQQENIDRRLEMQRRGIIT